MCNANRLSVFEKNRVTSKRRGARRDAPPLLCETFLICKLFLIRIYVSLTPVIIFSKNRRSNFEVETKAYILALLLCRVTEDSFIWNSSTWKQCMSTTTQEEKW